MKISKKIFLLLTYFFSLTCFSQEFYILGNEPTVITKTELNDKISSFNKRAKTLKRKSHDLIVNYKIIDTIKRNDSLIYKAVHTFNYVSNKSEKIYLLENKKLPELNLKDINSKKVTLKSLKNKVTFINLWFTKCFPCVKEIPLLNILQKKYNKKVNFLAITYNSKKEVNNFLKKKKFNFKHVINAKKYIDESLGIGTYPKIIIVDSNNIVRYIGDGIPSEYDYTKKTMKEFNQKDLLYLEKILNNLL